MTCPECQKTKRLIESMLVYQKNIEEKLKKLTELLEAERKQDTYSFRHRHETGG